MTDELVKSVAEKTGLDPEKAEAAVDAVLDFFRENPEQIRDHVDIGKIDYKGLLADAQRRAKPLVEKGKQAAGTAKEKVAPVAAQGADKAKEHAKKAQVKVKDLSSRNKNGSTATTEEGAEAATEAASSES